MAVRERDTKPDPGNPVMDRLKGEAIGLVDALGERALASVRGKVEGATGRLTGYVDEGAGPGLMAAVTGAKGLAEGKGPVRSLFGAGLKGVTEKVRGLFGGGGKGGGKGKKLKVVNIEESIDVGVPIRLAYDQWTQFADFPSFMKKVENVDQAEDEKLNWKAQVLWSHRTWESNILEQVPEDKIVWRSKGAKGYVDGAVTFHELAPNLTRILVVLEYHPQGLFEHTGNMWRAQGRRARLELKHFRRHVMSEAILHPDEVEGWRGVIEDGEVVKDHESALQEEQADGEAAEGQEPEDEFSDQDMAEDRGEDEGQDEDEERGEDEERYESDEDRELASSNGNGDGDEPAAGRRRTRAAGDGEGAPERGRRPAGRPQRSSRTDDRPQRTVRRSPAR
jgi:uncharacterized membrane protein